MIKIKTELDDIKEIVAKHPEAWKKVLDDGDIYDDTDLYSDLYEYYSTDPDYMPYGIQKARDGDPVVWITERLDDLGAFEKEMSKEEAEKIVDVFLSTEFEGGRHETRVNKIKIN